MIVMEIKDICNKRYVFYLMRIFTYFFAKMAELDHYFGNVLFVVPLDYILTWILVFDMYGDAIRDV